MCTSTENNEDKILLPHHEQQRLCTTRLPYRQGRKLTAVKVYTINSESNHLLIFGVPSLNLRQEVKALFSNFGKLSLFIISTKHEAEPFTETYHAIYEKIQSARIAKRMLDTKNFYGGLLHVCYAPELESIDETRQKLLQRHRDVTIRLKNLQKDNEKLKSESKPSPEVDEVEVKTDCNVRKLNMGEVNHISSVGKQIRDLVLRKKRKNNQNVVIEKKFKPCFVSNVTESSVSSIDMNNTTESSARNSIIEAKYNNNNSEEIIDIIDCTSVHRQIVSNINESLNYKNFGNEIIRKVPQKPMNTIKFNINNT